MKEKFSKTLLVCEDLQDCPNDHFQWDSDARQTYVCNNEPDRGWGWTGRETAFPLANYVL